MRKLPCLRYRVHVNDQLIARFEYHPDVVPFVKGYRNAFDHIEVKVGHATVWCSRKDDFSNIVVALHEAARNGG